MSIQVINLTKIYQQQKAVNDISFRVDKGEIVGFLGPNGAGKSTTMKIATGYVSPTSGTVLVGGADVTQEPMKVKRVTGYLPEHNPLYTDLYVHEYLAFVGKLYNLGGKELKLRVGEMIERCGLTPEQNKKIESLSKGYRQRVGLAQALIHNPSVLILDEPTTGLDPNQIVEIRKLIREVSENKTVIFSTHIMQEVQALCSRVVVINKGEIVADASIHDIMQSSSQQQVIIVEFEGQVTEEMLSGVSGVQSVKKVSANKFSINAVSGVDIRPELFRFAADNNLSLLGLKQEESSLESIFSQLTQQQ